MHLPVCVATRARRRAALALATASTLVLIALSHHPVVGKAVSAQDTLAQIVALQRIDGLVHGALMLILALLAGGLAVFSSSLGWRRPPVVIAMAAYGLGCCSVLGAMLLDGFAVPQLAAQFSTAPPAQVEFAYVLLRVLGIIIVLLTKAGIVSMCVALLAWSWALARTAWPFARACAALGLVAGLAPALLLLAGEVRLTPSSLMAIFGMHAVWNLAIAALLLRPATAPLTASSQAAIATAA